MGNEILVNDSENIPQVNPSGEFGSVMDAVQPRSSLGKAVVTIMAYSLECDRLEIESRRIQLAKYKFDKKMEIARENLAAAVEVRKTEIDAQKECMMRGLELYEKEIRNSHLSRKEYLKLLSAMSENMTLLVKRKSINTKAIKEMRLMISHLSSQLVTIETQAHEKSMRQLSPLLARIEGTRDKLLTLD